MKFNFFIICYLVTLSFAASVGVASPSQPQKQAYFKALPDIPLSPSMIEIEDESFVFDKAEGRVIESVGFLSVSNSQKTIQFYQDALARLGWKALNNMAFRRNNEQIILKIEEVPQGMQVRFRLLPQTMPMSR